ncbi:MAG: hypothetical protein Q8O04_12485 [Deltaproteobacteria bacterium]|nr:hypothetical protein [Deltaproteobacteria bacterium]
MTIKFDNIDRLHVIKAIETEFGSKLSKVGRRHIFLKNTDNIYFVILGGYGDWHAIPDDVIEQIEKTEEKQLVIAIRKPQIVKIYHCDMQKFLEQKDKYNRPGNNKFTFNIDEFSSFARIRQAKSVSLDLLAVVSYKISDRESLEKREAVVKILKQMTEAERSDLIKKLESDTL